MPTDKNHLKNGRKSRMHENPESKETTGRRKSEKRESANLDGRRRSPTREARRSS